MRFTACTLNLWANEQWERRAPAVRSFLDRHRPDILCLQELRPASLACVRESLPDHDTVRDDFAGWQVESNIAWNRHLFELAEYGALPVEIEEPLRRLFFARLRPRSGGSDLLVCTAHFTWRETAREGAGSHNPRLAQARATLAAIDGLQHTDYPCILLGDFNDSMHALRILFSGGFRECCAELGRAPVPTWPVAAIESGIPEFDDWILCRGSIQPMMIDVPDFYEAGVPPSDHRPVLACFRMAE